MLVGFCCFSGVLMVVRMCGVNGAPTTPRPMPSLNGGLRVSESGPTQPALLLCTNCGKDPQEEDANWCIACLMYVEPPLTNDELVKVRVFLSQPRRSGLKMLLIGGCFADRVIREGNGDENWWTRVRWWFWKATKGQLPARWWN